LKIPNLAVCSPDVGSIKMARAYAKRLNAGLILIDKRRPTQNVAEVMNIIGEVKDKNVLIIDDIIDTAGTFVNAINAIKDKGALKVYGACTHPILSGEAIDRLEASPLEKLYVTDTVPLRRTSEKIEVRSVSTLFAEAIIRTNLNESISSLFDVVI
jgi:ribose-phosphate pyrophosphokinase